MGPREGLAPVGASGTRPQTGSPGRSLMVWTSGSAGRRRLAFLPGEHTVDKFLKSMGQSPEGRPLGWAETQGNQKPAQLSQDFVEGNPAGRESVSLAWSAPCCWKQVTCINVTNFPTNPPRDKVSNLHGSDQNTETLRASGIGAGAMVSGRGRRQPRATCC